MVPLLPADTVASAETATPVPASPRLTFELFAVDRTVPAMATVVGLGVDTPPTKVVESPEASPMVNVPELSKVVVPAMELLDPVMLTL